MKLSPLQVEPGALAALANEACMLLVAGEFARLATKFGYAVALGRDPASAIKEDFGTSLADLGEASLSLKADPEVQLRYFKPDEHLYALAECSVFTARGCRLSVELVVSRVGNDFHATLEQISAVA